MNSTFFIILFAVFASFLVPSVCYSFIVRGSSRFNGGTSLQKSAFLPFAAVTFILSAGLFFVFYTPRDFLTSFSFAELCVPFAAVILIYLSALYDKTAKFFPMFLLAGAAAASAVIPDSAAAAVLPFAPIYNRLIICAAWFAFSFIYRFANSGDAMLAVQSATVAAGIAILAFINAIPMFLGVIGIIFAAAFASLMSFTWHPSRLHVSAHAACCFGFILFAPCVWTAAENAGSCVMIYALYFLVDFVWAVTLRLTFVEKYAAIADNTAYCAAVAEGVPPASAVAFSFRAQILLLFLGTFQALADNHGSLLLISVFITVWLLYKLRNAGEGNANLRDINRQVIEDLQDRVNDIKQYINKDKNF